MLLRNNNEYIFSTFFIYKNNYCQLLFFYALQSEKKGSSLKKKNRTFPVNRKQVYFGEKQTILLVSIHSAECPKGENLIFFYYYGKLYGCITGGAYD